MTLTELDDLRDKLHKTQQHLQNLCARIHRDGGHYADKRGLETAVRDADVVVANTFSQLAEAQAEIERLKAEYAEDVGKLLRSTKYIAGIAERGFGAPQPDSVSVEDFVLGYVKQLEQQLAASQATNEKLREFVKRVSEQAPEKPDYWSSCSQCEYNAADAEDLAAIPNDTTALNKLLAGVYEECAKECDRLDYWYSARAIRALAKQKGLI